MWSCYVLLYYKCIHLYFVMYFHEFCLTPSIWLFHADTIMFRTVPVWLNFASDAFDLIYNENILGSLVYISKLHPWFDSIGTSSTDIKWWPRLDPVCIPYRSVRLDSKVVLVWTMLECRLARLDFRKLDDPVTDPRVLAFFGKLDDPVTDRSHGNWVTQLHGTRHPRSYINICYDHYGAFGKSLF